MKIIRTVIITTLICLFGHRIIAQDSLVKFSHPFDKYALPVYTLRDNNSSTNSSNDSSKYASIQSKPRFYTNFESGRIGNIIFSPSDGCDFSYLISSSKDPKNPIDTLLSPSGRWFYFMVAGVKNKTISISLQNTDPLRAVYSYDNITWHRYDTTETKVNFNFTKQYSRDSVYIAYYVPYTNNHLKEKMDDWEYNNNVRIYSIGKSHQGRDLKMLIITNNYISDSDKKRIYIHGRIHPSETPCSWALEGLIEFLLEENQFSRSLRDNAVFYILPFSNPDGVALGYSRCDAIGVNMEINYNQPDSLTRPEVKNIKKFLNTTTYGNKPIDLFLNFHSQIAPHFTYWVHTAESTSDKYYKDQLLFANLTIDNNPYTNNECLSFSKIHPRYIEGFFWDNFKEKTLAITHETPYSHYNKNPQDEWVTIDNLKAIGRKTLQAISDYLEISKYERIVIPTPSNYKKMEKKDDHDNIYFGEYYLVSTDKKASATYKIKHLENGEYQIYKWVVGKKKTASDQGENCWQMVEEIQHQSNGEFKYVIKDIPKGETINAILLIKK